MSDTPLRIAMWSGPRNISTAMLRSFGSRRDTAVTDEPFYAHYLARTGIDHPGRDEVIASQPNDWRDVVAQLSGPVPDGKPVWYQKQMTLHLPPEFDFGFLDRVRNAFLIRRPEEVVRSYARKREDPTLEDLGFVQQQALFDEVRRRSGAIPPVVDAADVLRDPAGTLAALCAALGLPFDPAMLRWEAGRRATDGVWAPHWYANVEASTGFQPFTPPVDEVPERFRALVDACRPHYEALRRHRLNP